MNPPPPLSFDDQSEKEDLQTEDEKEKSLRSGHHRTFSNSSIGENVHLEALIRNQQDIIDKLVSRLEQAEEKIEEQNKQIELLKKDLQETKEKFSMLLLERKENEA